MLFRTTAITAISLFIAIFLAVGCAQNHQLNPVNPLTPDPVISQSTVNSTSSSSSFMWGFWQIRINAETSEAEAIPLRTAENHLDCIPFLEVNNRSTIKLKDIIIDGSSVELNVGLTHPFPGLYQYSGFDVRGIFITDGTFHGFASDGDLYVSQPDEPRLLNADGWTRWWNPTEFPIIKTILGYTDGLYGPKDAQINFHGTLNPYKYFSDDLTQSEVMPDGLDLNQRGVFKATSAVNYRHYSIDFGDRASWYVFNYAVDASHKFPSNYDGHSTPDISQIPDPFFSIVANQPEPFAVTVDESINTLYYASPTELGGDLVLTINIYDWQGLKSTLGVPGEITEVRVESPTLIPNVVKQANITTSPAGASYSTYTVDIANATPTGLTNQNVLITVVSKDGDYKLGYDDYATNFSGGQSAACAYQFHTPVVSPTVPVQTQWINLTSPNGGEVWISDTIQDVTWTNGGTINFVKIEYSSNGGAAWNAIDGGSGIQPNNGTYHWTIPSNLASDQMLVRVSDAADGDPVDQSDALFSIVKLAVTSPNGGEVWISDSTHDITWINGGTMPNVKIEYSSNGGGSWNTIDNAAANTGSYSWTIPAALESNLMLVRVSDAVDGNPTDESDAFFSVIKLTVTIPNGGEIWASGTAHDITWSNGGMMPNVKIEYSTNNGGAWNTIVNSAPNTGTYNWPIPISIASTQMLIRISDAADGAPVDQSDAVFTIEKITVVIPNVATDVFQVGQAKNITWTTGTGGTTVVQNVRIEFSKTATPSFATLPGATNVANTGSWSWTPVIGDVTTHGLIRITDVNHSEITDTSDNEFPVTNRPELTLAEYRSWYTNAASYQYRGRYVSNLNTVLPQTNYQELPPSNYTSWDFTAAPFSTAIGGSNMSFGISTGASIPRYASAPAFATNDIAIRHSITGTAGRRAYWAFDFDTTNNKLYYHGSSDFIDATIADVSGYGFCYEYLACPMTEQFPFAVSNQVGFPLYSDSAVTYLSGSGIMYWVNHGFGCNAYNDQYPADYGSQSVFDVIAMGDCKVPHGGGAGTTIPNCLLLRFRMNIADVTQLVHMGQLMYQWVDTSNGMVVAFIMTHNEGNSTSGMPYTYGYTNDTANMGVIGAWN